MSLVGYSLLVPGRSRSGREAVWGGLFLVFQHSVGDVGVITRARRSSSWQGVFLRELEAFLAERNYLFLHRRVPSLVAMSVLFLPWHKSRNTAIRQIEQENVESRREMQLLGQVDSQRPVDSGVVC